jgi:hypothetical protein
MLAALIGWKVAGIAGAAVATAAFYLPPALLVYGVARLWGRWRGNPWHQAIERSLVPSSWRYLWEMPNLVLPEGASTARQPTSVRLQIVTPSPFPN